MTAEGTVILADSADAERWFGNAVAKAENLTELMRDIGEMLEESTRDRFDRGVAPDGTAWAALADGSGRTPLTDTGAMRDSLWPDSGADWVELSIGARQARWHHAGTDPYEIRPSSKKALAWAGSDGPRGKVNHPGLPARPILGLSDEDGTGIERLVEVYFGVDDPI